MFGCYYQYIVDTVGSLPVILCEIDSTGSLKKKYFYANAQILAQDVDDGQSGFDRYFYLHDRLGSVRLVIDDQSAIANKYTYSPFGEDITSECTETVASPWKFTGQWYDAEINQYYLRSRQYDPQTARFTGRDPLNGGFKEPLTLHAYLYCLNDPINRTDPSGEWSFKTITTTISTGATMIAQWGRQMVQAGSSFISRIFAVMNYRNWATNLFARSGDLLGKGLDFVTRSYRSVSRLASSSSHTINSSWCFTGDTLIHTPNGKVPISEIKVGDYVWSYNEKDGIVKPCKVKNVFTKKVNSLVLLKVENEIIETTDEHPFWVIGRKWINAGQLDCNDNLKTFSGSSLQIDSVKNVSKKTTVYNIEVNQCHTYYVSKNEVLVHNKAMSNGIEITKRMYEISKPIAKGNNIRCVKRLVADHGGKAANWIKMKSWDELGYEVHWYFHKGIGVVEAKPSP